MPTATETKPQSSTLSSKGMLIGGQWVESASGALASNRAQAS